MDFARGDTTTKLKTLREVSKKDTGTRVCFKPDPEIFTESTIYDYGTLQARLRELSFLNKGVTITLKDERPGEEREEKFHAEGGLREMVAYLTSDVEQEAAAPAGRLHRDRAREHRDRAGDAVQRQLRRVGLLVREQHQHPRGRHAPHGLQERADVGHQQVHREVDRAQRRRTRTSASPATTCARASWRCCRSRSASRSSRARPRRSSATPRRRARCARSSTSC